VWLPPEKQKHSQWTLPAIVAPASSIAGDDRRVDVGT